jgi:hypothetical protein
MKIVKAFLILWMTLSLAMALRCFYFGNLYGAIISFFWIVPFAVFYRELPQLLIARNNLSKSLRVQIAILKSVLLLSVSLAATLICVLAQERELVPTIIALIWFIGCCFVYYKLPTYEKWFAKRYEENRIEMEKIKKELQGSIGKISLKDVTMALLALMVIVLAAALIAGIVWFAFRHIEYALGAMLFIFIVKVSPKSLLKKAAIALLVLSAIAIAAAIVWAVFYYIEYILFAIVLMIICFGLYAFFAIVPTSNIILVGIIAYLLCKKED